VRLALARDAENIYVPEILSKRVKAPKLTGRTPNAVRQVRVTRADLPLHCPMPGSTLWDSHPRVYIPLEKTGKGLCPYCGTEYVLDD
jgi:uncharacterized Zn-finger protein